MDHGARRTPGRTRRPRALTRGLLAVLVSALAVVAQPTPALAHTALVGTVPVAGDTVSLGLDRIELVFSEDLLAAGASVGVRGPGGDAVEVGAAGTSGSTVAARVRLSSPGRHAVTYRVVGADGHVVAGSLSFTVVAGTPDRASTSVSREALPGASEKSDAPGTVAWGLLVALLVAVGLRLWVSRPRMAGGGSGRTGGDTPTTRRHR